MNVRRAAFACALVVIALGNSGNSAGGEALTAGAGMRQITPRRGLDIVGGFSPFPSTNVHDELFARCLVLDDGTSRLALVTCDLVGLHRIVSDEARKLIQEKSKIPPSHVLISATHTHSASSALGQDRF